MTGHIRCPDCGWVMPLAGGTYMTWCPCGWKLDKDARELPKVLTSGPPVRAAKNGGRRLTGSPGAAIQGGHQW